MSFAKYVREVVSRFPASIAAGQETQVGRIDYEMSLFIPHVPPGGRVCDLGGGWGTMALSCAAAGLKAVLVDDYRERGFLEKETMEAMNALYRHYGVEVVSRDLVTEGLGFPEQSLDAITLFDTIEHWHGSPRRALHDAVRALRRGGRMVIATPNCVNLRKRITVPLGRGKWSPLAEWYDHELFRGHVREPDVDDLRFIAGDIGLRDWTIVGRNWNGYYSASRMIRAVTPFVDHFLRLRPSLCSDLYLVGNAPA
jgi:2-polyprenyl-3-methyl-5-hydroxy-6-metoxy-1,4-benzoquinol methylase